MDRIRLAVISDLHCMHGDSDKDRKISLLHSDDEILPAEKHPVQALKKLIKENGIRCDYVICPGDIANGVCTQGIISGFKFVEEIKEAIGAKMSFYSPGNHDVDSRDKLGSTIHTEPLRNRIEAYPVQGADDLINKFWADGYCVYNDEYISILIIDSTITHTNIHKVDQTIIPFIDKLKSELSSTPKKGHTVFKIAMCHHNPIKISNIDNKEYRDSTVIENGNELLQILDDNNYHLFIHGHKHMPRLNIYKSIPILSSGSFSSLENVKDAGEENTFHIVDLIKEGGNCKGTISTWIFRRGKGWSENPHSDDQLPAYTGFGACISWEDMAKQINDWLGCRDSIRFVKLQESFPEVNYLIPEQQKKIEKELKDRYNIEFQPNLGKGAEFIFKQRI